MSPASAAGGRLAFDERDVEAGRRFALSRRPKMPTALSRRPKMPTAFWACVVCNRARLVLQARCNSDAMENFGTAPDVFLQCYGRYDEQSHSPKRTKKIQQSSPTPQVA